MQKVVLISNNTIKKPYQDKTGPVTTSGQETEWVFSYKPQSSHRAYDTDTKCHIPYQRPS